MKSDQLCTLIISYGDPGDDTKQFTTAHSFYGTDPNDYPQTRRLIHNASLLPCITQSSTDEDLSVIRKGKQPTDHLNVKTITNFKSTRKENGRVMETDKKQPKMNVHEVTIKYEGYYPNKSRNYVNVIHDNVKSHEIKDITSPKYKQISKTIFDYTITPPELTTTPPIPRSSPPRDDIIKPKIIHTTFDNNKINEEKHKVRKDLDYVTTPKVTHFGIYDDTYTGNKYNRSHESLHEFSRSKSSPPPRKGELPKDKSTRQPEYCDTSDKSISPIMSTYEQIEMAKKIQKEMQTWKFRNGKPVVRETTIDDDDSISGRSGGRYGLDTREVSYIDSAYESTKGEYYAPNIVTSPKIVTTFEAKPAYAIPDNDSIKTCTTSFKPTKHEMTSRKQPYSSSHQLRTHETIISETIETEHRIIKSIKSGKGDKVYAEPAVIKNGEGKCKDRHESISKIHHIKDDSNMKCPSPRNVYTETYSAMSTSSKFKDSTSKKLSPYEVTNIVNIEKPKTTRLPYSSSESYSSTKLIRTVKSTKPPDQNVQPIIKPIENVITKNVHLKKESRYDNYNKAADSTSIIVKQPQTISTHIIKNISQPKKDYKKIVKSVVVEKYTDEEIHTHTQIRKPYQKEKEIEKLEKKHDIQPIPLITKPKETKKIFDDQLRIKQIVIHTQNIVETNRSKLIEPSPIIPIPKIPRITQTEPILRKEEETQTIKKVSSDISTRTIATITDDLTITKQEEIKKPSATIQIPSSSLSTQSLTIETKKPINIIKSITKDEGTNTDIVIEKSRTRSPSPQWRYETDEIIGTTKTIEEKKKTLSAEISVIPSKSKENVKKNFNKLVENNMISKQISKSSKISSETITSTTTEIRGTINEQFGGMGVLKKSSEFNNNTATETYNEIVGGHPNSFNHGHMHDSLVRSVTEVSDIHDSSVRSMNKVSGVHNHITETTPKIAQISSSNMTSTYKSAISPRVGLDGVKSSTQSSNTGFSKVFVETCKYSTGMSSMSQSAANRIRDDREREKKEMTILNDRLASYIEKVRFLEAQNRKLKADLDLLKSRCGKESYSIKEMYEKEIHEARQLFLNTNREREQLEKAIHELLEEIRLFRDKYDNAKYGREVDREKINKLIEQLCQMEAETRCMRKQIENLNDDVVDLKKQNALLLQELQKTRNDVDQETLNKIDYQNQVQTLLEEIRFISDANEQEIIDLQNMAYRDTTTENREYFKQELVSAMKDIREEYDQICEAQRTEMESWYRIKVQEIHTKCATKELEQSYCKEEVRKLRSQCIDIRGRLSELESRNAILEKQAEELRYQMSDEARSYEAQIADRDNQINKMKKEANALMIELQLLLDKKTTLDAEIAIYKSLLDGEANRVGLSQLTDRVRGYTFSNETLINQKRIVKGEQTTRSGFQRSAKGNVSIIEANLDGKVITLENSNRSKSENIGGWQIKRLIGGSHPREITYTFPKDFILRPLKTVKIYARNEGVHNPPESIVTNEETFGSGVHVQTFLYNHIGEERATFMQKSNAPF
uniref:SH2 domain-containing protein n=1 Tax=Strongyloides venezuelensis TaxID=75913 RepID=A0A0K0EY44_STRVS